MNKEEFIKELEKLNISLTQNQLEKLEEYYNLLIEKNKVINLTSITNKEDVYLKHFYDSLTISKIIDLNKNFSLADLGTGAGFPGIVLKIVFPNLNITLVDSLNKRINFLNEVIKTLDLKDIHTQNKRIEDFSKENIEKYDILVTRAVAKTNVILELGSQALKTKGNFILMKGDIKEELKNSENAIKKLGYVIKDNLIFNLPKENSLRTLLNLQKIQKTNKIYPRDFAKIKKNPL